MRTKKYNIQQGTDCYISQQTRIHSKARNLKIWSFNQSRVQEQHAYLSIGFLVFSSSSLLNLSFICVFRVSVIRNLAGLYIFDSKDIVVTTKFEKKSNSQLTSSKTIKIKRDREHKRNQYHQVTLLHACIHTPNNWNQIRIERLSFCTGLRKKQHNKNIINNNNNNNQVKAIEEII